MIAKHHKELQLKEQKLVKEEEEKPRRIAGTLAKMVDEFWGNIEKVNSVAWGMQCSVVVKFPWILELNVQVFAASRFVRLLSTSSKAAWRRKERKHWTCTSALLSIKQRSTPPG